MLKTDLQPAAFASLGVVYTHLVSIVGQLSLLAAALATCTARVTLAIVTALCPLAAAAEPLPQTTLNVRFFQITAEVASTPSQRAKGLMGRKSLLPNHGMLFIFDSLSTPCFWMRNTPLPLTIAFVGDDGRIVNFSDMQPFSDQAHCPAQPVRFALEMEQGWFAKRGVLPGDPITGPAITSGK